MERIDDLERIARQLGRAPRARPRVVARCAGGWPLAVEQPALDDAGRPFPTTFWLTCPRLVHAVGRLEDVGGVAALEQRLATEPALAASFADGRRRQIALRPALGELGIGGVRDPARVKCLHAHAAFALGAPPYAVGEAILAEAAGGDAARAGCCMEAAG